MSKEMQDFIDFMHDPDPFPDPAVDLEKSVRFLIEQYEKLNFKIGSCESFTAGLFCSTIASVPGASKVLQGGLVTYDTALKESIAGVDPEIIEKFGVISSECAMAMARCAREKLQADICVSFTGNAGPDAMEDKPAGLVYIAVADKDIAYSEEVYMPCERNELRRFAVNMAICMLLGYADGCIENLKNEQN